MSNIYNEQYNPSYYINNITCRISHEIIACLAKSNKALNIVDGGTSATSTTLATADRLVVNDAGTMVQVALSDLVTFLENGSVSGFDIDGGTY